MSERTQASVVAALCVALASAADATNQRFQDWSVSVDPASGSAVAWTTNESGSFFGEICFLNGKCEWFLAFDTRCDPDDAAARYPILASAKGATHLTLACGGPLESSDMFRYRIVEWQTLEELVRSSPRLGFAVPLESDKFQVLRFSTLGSGKATAAAENAVRAMQKPRQDTRTIPSSAVMRNQEI